MRSPEFQPQSNWFRNESLQLLEQQLGRQSYPGYPATPQRLQAKWLNSDLWNNVVFPNGPWWVNDDDYVGGPKPGTVKGAYEVDAHGRPLHPWFWEMVQNADIGVVCGKGAYWNWGPNYTADPIVVRRDWIQPHVLVIQRSDTGWWALPGGFVDDDELPAAAAVRETLEETGLDLAACKAEGTIIYRGPVADLRVTAHAWAETTAVLFELRNEQAARFTELIWDGGDDAQKAAWMPVSLLNEQLFGSHRLLIEQAMQRF